MAEWLKQQGATLSRRFENHMIPIEEIRQSEPSDKRSFSDLAAEARAFLESHSWCKRIVQGFLDIGWEGFLAVFFFKIEPARPGVDDSVWVIVGDLPSAYLCNDNPNGPSALDGYVHEMQKWVDAVHRGESVERLIPVDTPPTHEYADMLGSRLAFIREKLLPEYADQITEYGLDED